jgi:hypothetical protein
VGRQQQLSVSGVVTKSVVFSDDLLKLIILCKRQRPGVSLEKNTALRDNVPNISPVNNNF